MLAFLPVGVRVPSVMSSRLFHFLSGMAATFTFSIAACPSSGLAFPSFRSVMQRCSPFFFRRCCAACAAPRPDVVSSLKLPRTACTGVTFCRVFSRVGYSQEEDLCLWYHFSTSGTDMYRTVALPSVTVEIAPNWFGLRKGGDRLVLKAQRLTSVAP